MIRVGEYAGQDIALVQAAEHLTISFAGADLADIQITRDGDSILLTAASGASLQIVGASNIGELSILSTFSDGDPKVIHLGEESSLDLWM